MGKRELVLTINLFKAIIGNPHQSKNKKDKKDETRESSVDELDYLNTVNDIDGDDTQATATVTSKEKADWKMRNEKIQNLKC